MRMPVLNKHTDSPRMTTGSGSGSGGGIASSKSIAYSLCSYTLAQNPV